MYNFVFKVNCLTNQLFFVTCLPLNLLSAWHRRGLKLIQTNKLPKYFTRRLLLSSVNVSYPHHGQESVEQVNSQDKGLCAVTKEAGQAPQVLHFGISALCWDPTVILENTDMLLINLVGQLLHWWVSPFWGLQVIPAGQVRPETWLAFGITFSVCT